jgi:hypothetical protein
VKARTGGPFTRADARAAEVPSAEIRRLLRSGEWVVLRRGVYVERSLLDQVAGDAEREHALEVAGLLCALEHPAVAATTSAARILGLEFLRAPPAELMVATAARACRVSVATGTS